MCTLNKIMRHNESGLDYIDWENNRYSGYINTDGKESTLNMWVA